MKKKYLKHSGQLGNDEVHRNIHRLDEKHAEKILFITRYTDILMKNPSHFSNATKHLNKKDKQFEFQS